MGQNLFFRKLSSQLDPKTCTISLRHVYRAYAQMHTSPALSCQVQIAAFANLSTKQIGMHPFWLPTYDDMIRFWHMQKRICLTSTYYYQQDMSYV